MIEAVRHEARLNKKDDNGVRLRDHLESAAARGNVVAIAELEGPDVPEELAYLREWVYELHGRSGVGMAGLAPMSYATIVAWSALTGRAPSSLDVDALFKLDAVLLNPAAGEQQESE